MLFVTYNEALMWDRFERMFVIAAGAVVVVLIESLGSNPTWIFSGAVALVAQVLVVKCWSDIGIMSRPFENCWGFDS